MNTYSRAILVFSTVFSFFFMAPAFLGIPFEPYPLMSWGDVLDLLTPVVLLPLYWNLYRLANRKALDFLAGLPFIILAAIWVEGQGMHLAANSIGHLLAGVENSPAAILTYSYDEILSHYIWHLGVIGLPALILLRQWNSDQANESQPWFSYSISWLLYGFTFSAIILEAQTTPLGIPFLLIVTGVILIWGREKLKSQPFILFFFGAALVSLTLIAGWWLSWGELLEPSKWLNF